MNIVLISESCIVRDSLKNVLERMITNPHIELKDNIENIKTSGFEMFDLIFWDVEYKPNDVVEIIKEIKHNKIKLIILDRNRDKHLFKQAIKYDVDGYMLNINDKDDFVYIVKKVISRKNAYDSELLQMILKEVKLGIDNIDIDNCNLKVLTKRELEVAYEVGKGLDNKTIAKELHITEYTIKKHIKNICDKLGVKNRKEIIVYISKMN